MIGWLRNAIVIFVILTIAYAILSLKARWRQKDKLNADYNETDKTVAKEVFIAEGLEKYNRSFRPKLLLGVYGLPLIIITVLIYLAYA